jgi:hypothetical protein
MKRALLSFLAATAVLLSGTSVVRAKTVVPDGLVLPARLNSTLSSKNSKPGEVVTARIMQNVPLPDGGKIPAGATLEGRVISVDPASRENGGGITFRFDTLKVSQEKIPIAVHLRAIASFMDVNKAQLPTTTSDRGGSPDSWTTIQIGGDVVYRGGGPVKNRAGNVGVPVEGGVMSRLSANSARGCRDADERPMALWLFSSDACGTYDLPDLAVDHVAQPTETGEIRLRSSKGNVNVRSGAGLLLRVEAPGDPEL